MGQRLNIELKYGDKLLANCYFHWSGYTLSSLRLTKAILSYIQTHPTEFYDTAYAIKAFKAVGASLLSDPNSDRNNGWIGITEEEQKETRDYMEGMIEIDTESKTINFDCAYEYCEENLDDDEVVVPFDTEIDCEPDAIPFNLVDQLSTAVAFAELSRKHKTYFKIGTHVFHSIC